MPLNALRLIDRFSTRPRPRDQVTQAIRPVVESLEGRRLLHGLIDVAVDFRPAGMGATDDARPNLLVDVGRPYARQQADDLRFGWTRFGQAWRNTWTNATSDAAPGASAESVALATAATIGHRSNLSWEMELRDGTYDVTVTAGELVADGSGHEARIAVEGDVVLTHTPTTDQPFKAVTSRVTVTDGRLTLTAPDAMAATKLLYLEVQEVDHHGGDDDGGGDGGNNGGGGSQTPFGDSPMTLPTTIEAEHFDHGGQHVAFFDTDPDTNLGGEFRDDGPDIRERDGATIVGWNRDGEWLEYTLNSPAAATYDVSLRAATGNAGSTIGLSLDGNSVASVGVSGNDWASFTVYSLGQLKVDAGEQVLRVSFQNSGGRDVADLDWIRFTAVETDQDGNGGNDGGNGGGNEGSSDYANETLTLGQWETMGRLSVGLTESGVAELDGLIYMFGGLDSALTWTSTTRSYVYNPETQEHRRIADLPRALTHLPAIPHEGKIYLFGGFVAGGPDADGYDDVWAYDPQTNSYEHVTDMTLPISGHAGVMIGSRVYLMSGMLRDGPHFGSNSNKAFSIDLNDISAGWRTEADAPIARDHVSGATIDGMIYLIGGQVDDDEYAGVRPDVLRYDPSTRTWTHVASLPDGGRAHDDQSTVVYRDKIIVAGGNFNGVKLENDSDDIWLYDPSDDAWSRLGTLPGQRTGGFARVIDGWFYFMGGTDDGYMRRDVWRAPLIPQAKG